MRNVNMMQIINATNDKLDVNLDSTAKGMLRKKISNDGNFYYKSGFCDDYGWYESNSVIAERVAYEIGKCLGLNVLEYEIVKIEDVIYCKSRNFLDDEENIRTFAKFGIITYDDMLRELPDYVEYFNSILIFDFIINNIDRHLNNIGLIVNEFNNELKIPPIFDNGSSLYFNLTVEQLRYINNTEYGFEKFDVSKPFRTSHYKQIKLVESSGVLPKINLDFNVDEILQKYYSGERLDAIKCLIKERLNYVRKMYKRQ